MKGRWYAETSPDITLPYFTVSFTRKFQGCYALSERTLVTTLERAKLKELGPAYKLRFLFLTATFMWIKGEKE